MKATKWWNDGRFNIERERQKSFHEPSPGLEKSERTNVITGVFFMCLRFRVSVARHNTRAIYTTLSNIFRKPWRIVTVACSLINRRVIRASGSNDGCSPFRSPLVPTYVRSRRSFCVVDPGEKDRRFSRIYHARISETNVSKHVVNAYRIYVETKRGNQIGSHDGENECVTHPRMVAVHEELRLGPGGSGGHAGRHERVQYRVLAPSAVVHFVAAARLGEHADALGRRRPFPEHRVTSGVRSTLN